jgi:hypothetical protein
MFYSEQYGWLINVEDDPMKLVTTLIFRSHGQDRFHHREGEEYRLQMTIPELVRSAELNGLREEWQNSDHWYRKHFSETEYLSMIDSFWCDMIIENWIGYAFPYHREIHRKNNREKINTYHFLRVALDKATSWKDTDQILQEAYLEHLDKTWEAFASSARAETLFDSLVEDAAGFKERGWMDIRGSDGKRYRIHNYYHGNVVCIDDHKQYCCVVPDVPPWDHWAAQKIIIESCVEEFIKKANASEQVIELTDSPLLNPVDMYEQGI